MSGLYENQKTVRSLKSKIEELRPKNGEQYYFVFGHPRSDIGKGTLVVQLLNAVNESDAIKYDGLLNTNESGRHTAVGHDDFGIYESFNKGKRWGKEHYLLGGELYRDFINAYGENENLQINPHLSYYVEYCIHKTWHDIGKPKNLFIEVGGLITDDEVGPIFTPIVQRMQDNIGAKSILLTEIGWNGEYIKTKAIQSAVGEFLSRHIKPWCLVVRDSSDIKKVSTEERLEFERVILRKLYNNYNFLSSRIISVPYFNNLSRYTDYMKKRFTPLVSQVDKTKLFMATGNKSKLADFKLYLGDKYDIVSPADIGIKLDIPEGIDSIEDNAIAKARAYAVESNLITLGDDTGFFIKELNGEPGVALRRWGGELTGDVSNETFWKYLQKKTARLNEINCYFRQCVALVSPAGNVKVIQNVNNGILNKEKLQNSYNGTDYPLGAAFESIDREKTWDEMSDEEKVTFDKKFINDLKSALNDI